MKSLIIKLIFVILLLPIGSGWAAESEPVLLVYGDSLSAAYGIAEEDGWVNLLTQKLEQESFSFEVVNGSVSGETTVGGLARLPAMLNSFSPALVILELGANDGLRGLPLTVIRENLLTMIDLIQQSGADVLLAGIQIPPNYGPRYTLPFFEQFIDIAKDKDLPLVPFLIDRIPQQPELMQNDGLHPKAEAQFMILENVWPVLQPMLK
ncbi:MAG: arylesterase [Gammaproteobacteria bacterium]|jgi:acyl-CoA thioesterase-1|nr:arylesterase [Gammaproteobacteria bacterium]MDP7455641.1 arylesterase [Gammaproteobacteria bacterium]HJO11926.1 arylesterase [Gammaproteobacteria bacterium]|tara:strand:+ start:11219 stop:11842 length:624 start_codon:yes stop_codon:yes gene_type:complete